MDIRKIVTGYFWAVLNEFIETSTRVHAIIMVGDNFIERHPWVRPYLSKYTGAQVLVLDLSGKVYHRLKVIDGFLEFEASFDGVLRHLKIDLAEIYAIGDPDKPAFIDFNAVRYLFPQQGAVIYSVIPFHVTEAAKQATDDQEATKVEARPRPNLRVVK